MRWCFVAIFAAFLQNTSVNHDCTVWSGFFEDNSNAVAAVRLNGSISIHGTSMPEASRDFGGIYHYKPAALVSPKSVDDIVRVVALAGASATLTVAARGNGHSLSGQAQALNGIVVNMSSLKGIDIFHGSTTEIPFVDASAGELWVDVLNATLGAGLAPRSWTDYLDLSVGGTLSNAGISGQTFRFGPQIRNVLQLEIVTGTGELITCNSEEHEELFYGALGGLGQFGIITRARIILRRAPQKARWIRAVYWRLEDFMHDQELLISLPEGQTFDYIEGFVFVNNDDPINGWPSVPFSSNSPFDATLIPPTAGPVLYCLEVALYYYPGPEVDEIIHGILSRLRFLRGLQYSKDMSYFDFLYRVHAGELADKARGVWDAPHPWLNLFVPKSQFAEFDRKVFKEILRHGVGGRMLAYPMHRSKWDSRMSAVVPEEDIFYVVSILRFNRPYPAGPDVWTLLAQNEEILRHCKTNGIRIRQYLGRHKTEDGWKLHFGSRWNEFRERKRMFDPKAVLAPGQNIFPRTN